MTWYQADVALFGTVLTEKLQLALLGMSTEYIKPQTGGLQSLSPSGHYGALASGTCLPPSTPASWSLPHWRAYLAAAVLCYINLLNYMNWFIIPGEDGRGSLGQYLQPPPFYNPTTLYPWRPSSKHTFLSRNTSLVVSPQ